MKKLSIILFIGFVLGLMPQDVFSQEMDNIDKVVQLLEIGENNGTIKDDSLYRIADCIYEEFERLEAKKEEITNVNIVMLMQQFSIEKYKIQSELKKRRITKVFVPYINIYLGNLKRQKRLINNK